MLPYKKIYLLPTAQLVDMVRDNIDYYIGNLIATNTPTDDGIAEFIAWIAAIYSDDTRTYSRKISDRLHEYCNTYSYGPEADELISNGGMVDLIARVDWLASKIDQKLIEMFDVSFIKRNARIIARTDPRNETMYLELHEI